MLRKLLSWLRPGMIHTESIEPPTDEDFHMFLDLCSVWPSGPAVQTYIDIYIIDPRFHVNMKYAGLAAEEIRHSIETSDMSDTLIGIDQIEILKRISYASGKDR